MSLYTDFGLLTCVVLVIFHLLQYFVMVASAKATFNYEFLDTDNTILKLRCDSDCSTDTTVLTIVIYNATSMTQMAAVNSGKPPNAFKSSVQDVSCFVAGGLSQGESCHLELVITNCNILTHLNFGCNESHSDIKGTISTAATPLKVERKASREASHSISTTTLIVLIVIIIVLFLLAVFFLSVWLRGCCRHRERVIYQMSSQGEVNNSQVFPGDTTSVLSFPRSPTKILDRRESAFKFPINTGSVRRMTSRSETNVACNRIGHMPLPPVPPPKLYWRERQNSQKSCNSIKVATNYAKPQDAIEPDFSQDGDVTSSNGGTQQFYACATKPGAGKQATGLYSCVSVRSVDV